MLSILLPHGDRPAIAVADDTDVAFAVVIECHRIARLELHECRLLSRMMERAQTLSNTRMHETELWFVQTLE